MRSVKKLMALLLIAALCFALVGCTSGKPSAIDPGIPASGKTTAPEAPAEEAPAAGIPAEASAEDAVPAAVAATLGSYNVYVSDVEYDYSYFISYMSYYGMEAPTDPAEIAEYVEMIVDSKISDLALAWQADQMGISLTPEKEAEIEQGVAEQREGLIETYRGYAVDELGEDAPEAELDARTTELLEADVLAYMGCDFETYMASYRETLTASARADLVEEAVKAGVTLEEGDTEAWFAENMAADKADIDENPLVYRDYQEAYETHRETIPSLYAPEGFVRVQMISVTMDEESAAAYAGNVLTMAALEAEFGALSLNGQDPTRRAEIRTEYNALVAANEALAGSVRYEVEGIRDRALTSNIVFSALAMEYDDTLTEEAAENGYLLYVAGEDTVYPAELTAAAAALADGEISGIIEADGTFYIIRRVGAVPAGEIDLASIREAADAQALLARQEAVWAAASEEYAAAAAAAAVKYPAHYANIGL